MPDDLSIYDQILLVALNHRKHPDFAYQHRCLARWFSHNFSTPYDLAFNMHFEDLLLHKFEWELQEAKISEVNKIFKKEFITKKKEIVTEEAEKADFEAWGQQLAKKELEKREKDLEKAEKELKKKQELPEGIEIPKDIKRTF